MERLQEWRDKYGFAVFILSNKIYIYICPLLFLDINKLEHRRKLKLKIDIFSISCEIALTWMPKDLTDDLSTLVLVMAWCRQATSHYQSQYWPRFLLPCGIIRPQWVKMVASSRYHSTMEEKDLFTPHNTLAADDMAPFIARAFVISISIDQVLPTVSALDWLHVCVTVMNIYCAGVCSNRHLPGCKYLALYFYMNKDYGL